MSLGSHFLPGKILFIFPVSNEFLLSSKILLWFFPTQHKLVLPLTCKLFERREAMSKTYILGAQWYQIRGAQTWKQGDPSPNQALLRWSGKTLEITYTSLSFLICAVAAAKSLQSCPTLSNPIDSSPPSSPVSGILQARTLEWVAIYFSNAWKWKVKVKSLSCVWLLAIPWTEAC